VRELWGPSGPGTASSRVLGPTLCTAEGERRVGYEDQHMTTLLAALREEWKRWYRRNPLLFPAQEFVERLFAQAEAMQRSYEELYGHYEDEMTARDAAVRRVEAADRERDARGSMTCPYCSKSEPHHHDRCPSCDAPAVKITITGGRCECMKSEDGTSIHGLVSYDYCKKRGWEYGICWSCFKKMPSEKWVHLRPDITALQARVAALEAGLRDMWSWASPNVPFTVVERARALLAVPHE
jgi:hypothetical protein